MKGSDRKKLQDKLATWYAAQDRFGKELYRYWLEITKENQLPGAHSLQAAVDAVKLTKKTLKRFKVNDALVAAVESITPLLDDDPPTRVRDRIVTTPEWEELISEA